MKLSAKIVAGASSLAIVSALALSGTGADAIKKDEGLRQTAYLDAVKIPTVCYGSTRGVQLGMRLSKEECDTRFSKDIISAEQDVKRSVKRELTQEQYDALISFVFNVGGPNFRSSTLLRKINQSDCYGAANEFQRWIYAKKVPLRGLQIRRANEAKYFLTGCQYW